MNSVLNAYNDCDRIYHLKDKDIIQAIFRILCDEPPPRIVDAAYLFAQTPDNEPSIIAAAKTISSNSFARKILILDNGAPSNVYRGYRIWKSKLLQAGIPEAHIAKVPLHKHCPHNTLTEAKALIQYVKSSKIDSLLISSPPFHLLRSFMTIVHAAGSMAETVRFYSYPGLSLKWSECVTHSQGTLISTRAGLIEAEIGRIQKYYAQGNLVSYRKVIKYLDQRSKLEQS